jgi:hypothetical protein
MTFFDFSRDVQRAVDEVEDAASRLSAKTTIHRARFPAAVKRAGFQFLTGGSSFIPGNHDLVIGAAPWSDPDLSVLENLAPFARSGTVRISVFDIDDLDFSEMVRMLPGICRFMRTPVVLQYRHSGLSYFGEGQDAIFTAPIALRAAAPL